MKSTRYLVAAALAELSSGVQHGVHDFECIWSRAYDRLNHEGRAEQLLAHAPVVQDQNLRGTSSWANTWLGRDHLAKKLSPKLLA